MSWSGSKNDLKVEIDKFLKIKNISNDPNAIKKRKDLNKDDYFAIGKKNEILGNYQYAIKCYKQSIHLDSSKTNLESFFRLARSQRMIGYNDESIESYKNVISMDTNHILAHRDISVLYMDLEKLNNANFHIKKLMRLDSIKGKHLRAVYLHNHKNDYLEASSLFSELIQLDSSSVFDY